jgi:hypothetical protein
MLPEPPRVTGTNDLTVEHPSIWQDDLGHHTPPPIRGSDTNADGLPESKIARGLLRSSVERLSLLRTINSVKTNGNGYAVTHHAYGVAVCNPHNFANEGMLRKQGGGKKE